MTSGDFHSLPVEKIIVPEWRQRREFGDIGELADSISRLGLIHPPVITRDLILRAGGRRLRAVKSLGWTTITCQYTDEVDPLVLHAIELEENIKRKDLTWQEECLAYADYHDYWCSIREKWTPLKTADAIGRDKSTITKNLAVAPELRNGNPKVLNAPTFSAAYWIVTCANERKELEAEQEHHKQFHGETETEPLRGSAILNVDFTKWVETYDGPKFNFLHCDFPYGINADKMQQGDSVLKHGAYEDTEETYWHLLETLCVNIPRICKESAHIMFWFSMHHYQATLDLFKNHTDIEIDPFPLVWHKSDNIGVLPEPHHGPRRIYETCLFGSLRDRKIVSAVSNLYAAPTDRKHHMSPKPVPVLRHFFRMFVDQNTRMLDPTCGSGTSLRAAEALGAKYVLGIEIEKEFADTANLLLERSRRERSEAARIEAVLAV
jgi:DNA methylase/ParB-like nuclease domain